MRVFATVATGAFIAAGAAVIAVTLEIPTRWEIAKMHGEAFNEQLRRASRWAA